MKMTAAFLLALMTLAGSAEAVTVSAQVGPLIKQTVALIAAKNYKAASAKLDEADAVESYPDDTTVIKQFRIVIAEGSDPTHHHCSSARLGSITCDGRQTRGAQP